MTLFLQFLLALTSIVIVGLLTYKITLFLGYKIIDVYSQPCWARKIISLLIGLFFGMMGAIQLEDFMLEDHLSLSAAFPLTFLVAGFFLFAAYSLDHK